MATSDNAIVVESSEDLTSLVRQYRCLYDKSFKYYKNKRMKINAWNEISAKMDISADECRRRYYNIRTAFGRYLKSRIPPSGSERDSIEVKPEYQSLRWLISHIEHRNSSSDVTTSIQQSASHCIEEQEAEHVILVGEVSSPQPPTCAFNISNSTTIKSEGSDSSENMLSSGRVEEEILGLSSNVSVASSACGAGKNMSGLLSSLIK